MEKFNTKIKNWQLFEQSRSSDEEVQLSLLLSTIISDLQKNDAVDLNCTSIEMKFFFINLHRLISDLIKQKKIQTKFFWLSISVLEISVRNEQCRQFLRDGGRFLTLFPEIFTNLASCNEDKKIQIYNLLEKLTVGLYLSIEEQYIVHIIEHLINLATKNCENDNNFQLNDLALASLINICQQNQLAVWHLIHFIDMVEFTKQLQSKNTILNSRMFFILTRDVHINVDREDYVKFLAVIFPQIEKSIENKNCRDLRYISEIISDAKSDGIFLEIINNSYTTQITESIEKSLNLIDNEYLMNGLVRSDDIRYTECVNLLFDILNSIFDLFDQKILPIIKRLSTFSLTHIKDKNFTTKAFITLRHCLIGGSSVIEMIPIISDLLLIVKSNSINSIADNNIQQIIAMFQFLLTCKNQSIINNDMHSPAKIIELINNQANNFNNLIEPLFNETFLNPFTLTKEQLSMYIHLFNVLMEYQINANNVFKHKLILYILARCIMSSEPDLCCLALKLAKHDQFPVNEVSKIKSHIIDIGIVDVTNKIPSLFNQKSEKPLTVQTVQLNNCCRLKRPAEERLDSLIERLEPAATGNTQHQKSITTSNILDLYNTKIFNSQLHIKELEQRLFAGNQQITEMTHQYEQLTSVTLNQNNILYSNQFTIERLESDIEERTALAQSLKEAFRTIADKEFQAKKELKTLHTDYEKREKIFQSEMANLNQQLVTERQKADLELRKANRVMKEETKKKEELEMRIRDTESLLNKTNDNLNELKKQLKLQTKEIDVLKENLAEKERDLEENNDLKNTILSLMNKSKKK